MKVKINRSLGKSATFDFAIKNAQLTDSAVKIKTE